MITLNGTTGISGVDGSSATPALQGNDSNTGVSFGTDTVTINTGGVARVTTDASGNVGIGTATPATKLQVSGGSTAEVRVVSSGNLTTGSASIVRFGGSNSATSGYVGYGGTGSTIDLFNTLAGAITFGTNNTERGRFDSSGRFLIARSTAYSDGSMGSPTVQTGGVNGVSVGIGLIQNSSASTGAMGFANTNGYCGGISTAGTSTTYATSSDYRLKENVAPMTGALQTVAALKPVTYTWKADGSSGQGFIAHELQEVVPDCVTGTKDAVDDEGKPQYQGVDTSFLVATLVSAIQEQQALITQLTARLEALENK